ncbi:VOC family protein [Emergencia sp.]|uniref:VOC family protein n=1 Tax=Emergencia sp. TaxID=1926557 RepID=UPI003AF100FE
MAVITRALHTGISVLNMDEALVWYKENLDFDLVDDDYVEPLHARICFIKNGNYQIELFQYDHPKPLPAERRMPNDDLQTVGTKHVAFEVDNIAEMKDRLQKNHVEIAHEVMMEGNNVMFIRDNSGVLIELIQNN